MKKLLRWPILWWLRFWAKLAFSHIRPIIIGVTGSAGKSSAVSAITLVAKRKFKRVKVSEKANSESGIPADMLGLHFTDYSFFDWLLICFLAPIRAATCCLQPAACSFNCYIAEMGIDEPISPKNMGYLLTILKPDIGVILNALPVHTEQFERSDLSARKGLTLIESIAAEKGRLITENQNLRWAILNSDQPEIASLKPGNDARVVTFGKEKDATVVIESVKPSLEGTSMTFRLQKSIPESVEGPVLSEVEGPDLIRIRFPHLVLPYFYGHSIASALAVGLALDVDPKQACDAISKQFNLLPGRGQLLDGINETTIIDSSYNASRKPMIGSLRLLREIAGERKKIAILGDMRELGTQSRKEHERVADELLKTVDQAILVGTLMKKFVLPILRKHHKPVEWFLTAGEAARFLLEVSQTSSKKFAKLRGGEVILVKGSQNTIFLEIVVEALLAHPADVNKLCRRGSFWDQQRKPYRENIL